MNSSFRKMSALVPLDRHADVWVIMLARALMRRTERGKACGSDTVSGRCILETVSTLRSLGAGHQPLSVALGFLSGTTT